MSVHAAGPRLYQQLKFRHLVKGAGSGGARSANVALNLVPFVDMMTMLVSFLLMVFSSTGALLQAQKGLDLPKAESKALLQGAPIIMVTKGEITVIVGRNGQLITTIDTVLHDESPTAIIDQLHERLKSAADKIKADVASQVLPATSQGGTLTVKDMVKACEDAKSGIRPEPGKACPDGLAILQADETTDIRVINKIVATAKQAGFDNLMFAIKNK